MSGSSSGVKQVIQEISEAVVKPLADEVGKAIEYSASSVISGTVKPQDPAAVQKRQEDESKAKQAAVWRVQKLKEIDEAQTRVRAQQKQVVEQQQVEDHRDEKVKQFKVVEKNKKQQNIAIQQAQTATEIKGRASG